MNHPIIAGAINRLILVAAGLTLVAITATSARAATQDLGELVQSVRHAQSVKDFRKDHPCPVTGKFTGACTGWVVDHGIPLCAGGADKPYNMHWQMKAESYLKDADERRLCAALKLKKSK